MRALILISMLSVPAFAAKDLEQRPLVPGQPMTCEAMVKKPGEVELRNCRPAGQLPKSLQSLGERKAK
jgi:hypothetical protein